MTAATQPLRSRFVPRPRLNPCTTLRRFPALLNRSPNRETSSDVTLIFALRDKTLGTDVLTDVVMK
jgi:hypothetical protein